MMKVVGMRLTSIQINEHILAMQANLSLHLGENIIGYKNLQYLREWSYCFNPIQYNFSLKFYMTSKRCFAENSCLGDVVCVSKACYFYEDS